MFTMLVRVLALLFLTATTVLAIPTTSKPKWSFTVPQRYYEVFNRWNKEPLNPAAVVEATCIDINAHIVYHDQNVAELAICDGIAGDITKCRGSPATTIGQSGSARFTLKPTVEGALINISKTKWDQCVRAARDRCPTGSVRAICAGGATTGNVEFALENSQTPSSEL